MLNHTYTSVKNANLVDCGKKQHIPSQPSALIRDNYLGEYRTELDKKKVLANLGITSDLLLEWEYIKGDIGKSQALMDELDVRTKYISEIDGFQKTVIEGIKWLESTVGGEQDVETEQDNRIQDLEDTTADLIFDLEELKEYLETTVEIDINELQKDLNTITEKVANITNLIQVSSKAGNALKLIGEEELEGGETPGLYVPDLSTDVNTATENIEKLREDVDKVLETYVTKEQLGGGEDGFEFVSQDDFEAYTDVTDEEIADIKEDLKSTVKTGEDGHVATLYVNKISKNNDDDNIKITNSLEPESGIPLDVRSVVTSKTDLAKLNAKICYAGMGVVVKDESALYILREPSDGNLTQEFIENIDISWKCSEDLIIQVLTKEEYETLLVIDPETGKNKINPTKFYYIYEEDTKEPIRSDFSSEEAYQEAYNAWLKILSQEYMSAAWGIEIETKMANKASQASVSSLNSDVKQLQDQIELLKKDESDSILALEERLTEIENKLNELLTLESRISALEESSLINSTN